MFWEDLRTHYKGVLKLLCESFEPSSIIDDQYTEYTSLYNMWFFSGFTRVLRIFVILTSLAIN